MNREAWINELSGKARAARWLIDEIWGTDIDELLESETDEEYEDALSTMGLLLDNYLYQLRQIRLYLPTMKKH